MTDIAERAPEPADSGTTARRQRRWPSPLRRRRSARPPTARSIGSMALTWMLAAVCLLAAWATFYTLALSGLQEAHAQHNAYAKFREQLSQQLAPLGGLIDPGAPVALLSAPTIGLKDVVVVEGTAAGDLAKGPGHRRDTPLPGQTGITVVYGRATLFGGPFSAISHAQAGDRIVATTGQGVFTYIVRDVRRVGDPYPQPLDAGAGGLTLVTAEGASVDNLWRPERPLYVDTVLQGKPRQAPGGGVTVVPEAEQAMHGDVGSLFRLVLWIPLLVFASVGSVWAVARWGPWQAWLVGAPVVLGALWGVTETAVQLLPNLM